MFSIFNSTRWSRIVSNKFNKSSSFNSSRKIRSISNNNLSINIYLLFITIKSNISNISISCSKSFSLKVKNINITISSINYHIHSTCDSFIYTININNSTYRKLFSNNTIFSFTKSIIKIIFNLIQISFKRLTTIFTIVFKNIRNFIIFWQMTIIFKEYTSSIISSIS